MKIKQRISAIFIVIGFLMCMAGIFQPVSAAQNTAGITLNCIKEGRVLSDMNWHIYYVGEIRHNKFEWSDTFLPYADEIAAGEAIFSVTSKVADFASTLKNYTITDKLPPLESKKTDESGNVTFSGLSETGMYLLTADDLIIKNSGWSTEPMLYTFDGTPGKVIEVYPKIIATLDEGEYSVRKTWMNLSKTQEERVKTARIKVARYCNGEYVDTLELSEANDWTETWAGEVGEEWTVKEVEIPAYFTVVYRKRDTEYIVENTYQRPNGSSWFEWEESDMTTPSGDSSFTEPDGSDTTPPPVSTEETSTTTSVTFPAGRESETIPTSVTTNISDMGTTTTTVSTGLNSDSNSVTSTTKTTVTTTTRTGSGKTGTGSGGSSSGNTVRETKLPQTGQLWYPVPILSFGGILLISIGMKLKKDDET